MEVKDDAGYFFSRIGELCLTAESELQSQQRRTAPKNLLVCSNRFGITAWADGRGALHQPPRGRDAHAPHTGLYVAHTADLLQQLEPWNDDETCEQPATHSPPHTSPPRTQGATPPQPLSGVPHQLGVAWHPRPAAVLQ